MPTKKVEELKHKSLIENFKKDHTNVKEVALISNGDIIFRNFDINCPDEIYSYGGVNLLHAANHIIENLYEETHTNRIVIRLSHYSMILSIVKTNNILVVLYDNKEKEMDRQMLNSIGLLVNKLKPTIAF